MKRIAAVIAFVILLNTASAAEVELYNGEPFGEALHDLVVSGAIPVSHSSVKASPLERIDAFKLRDGRILILHSKALKIGEPYSIKTIAVTRSPDDGKLQKSSPFKLPSSTPVPR
jgi:hypothetical protein